MCDIENKYKYIRKPCTYVCYKDEDRYYCKYTAFEARPLNFQNKYTKEVYVPSFIPEKLVNLYLKVKIGSGTLECWEEKKESS